MPYRSEQQIIIQSLVMQAESIQHMRYREYDVVMFHGKGTMHQILDPESLFGSLAFGTMPVTTAVITVANATTGVAFFFMTTQCSCAATGNLPQHPLLQGR